MKLQRCLDLAVLAGLLCTPLVARAEPMVGLKVPATGAQSVVLFDSATPGTVIEVPITGLATGEVIAGIARRPDTGGLYGFSEQGQLYTLRIDPNGVPAVKVGTPVTPDGAIFGLAFNPAADLLRITSNTRQNLRVNPTTGALVQQDTQLSYAVANDCGVRDTTNLPQIMAVAYRNNFGGALGFSNAAGDESGLLQYGIDTRTANLVKIGGTDLNDGCVQIVGNLGALVTPQTHAGLDISPATGIAYASLTTNLATSLYTVNLATGAATLVGALSSADVRDVIAFSGPKANPVVGLTKAGELVRFNASLPETLTAPTMVTGLGTGETLVGIDFRPSTGELWGLSSNAGIGHLYKIDKATGAASVIDQTGFGLSGTTFGMDFNPVSDALRIVSNTGNNYRVNFGTLITVDTNLDQLDGPDASNVPFGSGVAYTNSVAPAPTSTRLFFIDPAGRALLSQGTTADGGAVDGGPNGGQLFFVAPLGVQTTSAGDSALVGFDIAPDGTAYASLSAGGVSRLYEVSLTEQGTPAVRWGQRIGTGTSVLVDIAVEHPTVIVATDAGVDAGPDAAIDSGPVAPADAGSSSSSSSSSTSSSGSPPITIDPGGKVPGSSGQTEDVPAEDDGCSCRTTPSSIAPPSALVLAIASLWLMRRKKR